MDYYKYNLVIFLTTRSSTTTMGGKKGVDLYITTDSSKHKKKT